jgi:hypothetical protein
MGHSSIRGLRRSPSGRAGPGEETVGSHNALMRTVGSIMREVQKEIIKTLNIKLSYYYFIIMYIFNLCL